MAKDSIHEAMLPGSCRLRRPLWSTRSRRRLQRTPVLPSSCGPSTVMILDAKRIFLCRLSCSSSSNNNNLQSVEWDDSVEILSQDPMYFLGPCSSVFYKLQQVERFVSANSQIKQARATVDFAHGVDASSAFATPETSLGFLNSSMASMPLLSIVFQVRCSTTSIDEKNPYTVDLITSGWEFNPRLSACLKRHLAGTRVVWGREDSITTRIDMCFFDRHWSLTVESVVVSQSLSVLTGCFDVLPSTRITFVPAEIRFDRETVDERFVTSQERTLFPIDLGTSPVVKILNETIECLRHSDDSIALPRVFVLSGPPGVGKTHGIRIATQYASRQGPCKLIVLQGSELLSAGSAADASLSLLRYFVQAANATGLSSEAVAVLFLDECDALFASDIIAASLGSLLDRMADPSDLEAFKWRRVVVVAATNRVEAIPVSLQRPGRLEREVSLFPPSIAERISILQFLLRDSCKACLKPEEVEGLAESCVGYVAADLVSLVRHAKLLRLFQDVTEKHDSVGLTYHLLKSATKEVAASALRDASLSAPPNRSWKDVAGNPGGAKTLLRQAVEWPLSRRCAYECLGLTPPRGILLYGPPGCAKTSLARAAAGASNVAFLSLAPADVYASSYIGEAEAIVRRTFALARSAAPCVLFFDEIDAVLGSDGKAGHSMSRGSSAEARVLSTFLNEMDGVDGESKDGVLVLGATNRPWTLDVALLRPGRFDKIIYVPPPDFEGRQSILNLACREWIDLGLAPDIDIEILASEGVSGNLTGAEIVGACREAASDVIRNTIMRKAETPTVVWSLKHSDLESALQAVQPILSNPTTMLEFDRFEADQKLM
jgi:SpoVK/Ycf46/Vps4 family AAA+-type ATPase